MFRAKRIELDNGLTLQELSIQHLINLEKWEQENPTDKLGSACRMLCASVFKDNQPYFTSPEEVAALPWSAVVSLVEKAKQLNGIEKKD